MDKPKKIDINCPKGCGKLELTQEELIIYKVESTYKGEQWVFKCPKCKTGYTTTESDEISLKTLKKVNNGIE